jgi:16S rRNA (guanine527-N7)-methyltransferase
VNYEGFAKLSGLDVSRETHEKFCVYADLLKKWQKSINLISPKTLDDIWTRHFIDSVQLLLLTNSYTGKWLDIGSGAGFPCLPIAIICNNTKYEFTLCESDQRKTSFLKEVARQTDTKIRIEHNRIENLTAQGADIITARALAPLPRLLEFAYPHLNNSGVCFFHKGQDYLKELEATKNIWTMQISVFKSKTSMSSAIVKLENIERASNK